MSSFATVLIRAISTIKISIGDANGTLMEKELNVLVRVIEYLKGTMSAIFSNSLISQKSYTHQKNLQNNSPVLLKVTISVSKLSVSVLSCG